MSLFREQRLTLSQAAQRLDKNSATIWRWCLKGCKGIRLESALLGHVRFTSVEAIERFISACTAAADGLPAPMARTNRARAKAIKAAERELAEA